MVVLNVLNMKRPVLTIIRDTVYTTCSRAAEWSRCAFTPLDIKYQEHWPTFVSVVITLRSPVGACGDWCQSGQEAVRRHKQTVNKTTLKPKAPEWFALTTLLIYLCFASVHVIEAMLWLNTTVSAYVIYYFLTCWEFCCEWQERWATQQKTQLLNLFFRDTSIECVW